MKLNFDKTQGESLKHSAPININLKFNFLHHCVVTINGYYIHTILL